LIIPCGDDGWKKAFISYGSISSFAVSGGSAAASARELQNTGRHFVAIDIEVERFEENLDKFPALLYLHGDASDDDLMEAADIEDARGLFAVTGDDSRNLMIIITARQLNPNACASWLAPRNCEMSRKCARRAPTR
jgi:voltage-gated potassium channel